MTAAVAEVEVEVSEPRVVGSVKCRRCPRLINGVEEVAHLVPRRGSDNPDLPPLTQWIIVCGGCLQQRERGYLQNLEAHRWHIPSLALRSADRMALTLAFDGKVYRVPHQIRVMEGRKPANNDPQITHAGYRLLKWGLIAWNAVEGRKLGSTGPTAWAYVTPDGKEWMRLEAAGELEGLPDDDEA